MVEGIGLWCWVHLNKQSVWTPPGLGFDGSFHPSDVKILAMGAGPAVCLSSRSKSVYLCVCARIWLLRLVIVHRVRFDSVKMGAHVLCWSLWRRGDVATFTITMLTEIKQIACIFVFIFCIYFFFIFNYSTFNYGVSLRSTSRFFLIKKKAVT